MLARARARCSSHAGHTCALRLPILDATVPLEPVRALDRVDHAQVRIIVELAVVVDVMEYTERLDNRTES